MDITGSKRKQPMGVLTNHLNVTPLLVVLKIFQKQRQQQQQDNARRSAKEVGKIYKTLM